MKVSAVYDMKIENPRKTIQELSIRMKFGGHVQKEKKKKKQDPLYLATGFLDLCFLYSFGTTNP